MGYWFEHKEVVGPIKEISLQSDKQLNHHFTKHDGSLGTVGLTQEASSVCLQRFLTPTLAVCLNQTFTAAQPHGPQRNVLHAHVCDGDAVNLLLSWFEMF